jgi:hypothetical protein
MATIELDTVRTKAVARVPASEMAVPAADCRT